MNKNEKVINTTAVIMKDICYMILKDEYGVIGGYDYSESGLFRFVRRRLREVIKQNCYNIKDINNLRANLYCSITEPLCINISEEFKRSIY
jgi:hypothetical protein